MRKLTWKQYNVVFAVLFMTLVLSISNAFAQNEGVSLEPTPAVAVDATPVPAEVPKEVITTTGEVVTSPPAQVIEETEVPAEVTNESFFASIANAIGQIKGATSMTIALIISQLLIQFTKTGLFGKVFKKVDGGTKLTIVLALTTITTFLTMLSQGMAWGAALSNGAFLSGLMVVGHQIYKQWFEKKTVA